MLLLDMISHQSSEIYSITFFYINSEKTILIVINGIYIL